MIICIISILTIVIVVKGALDFHMFNMKISEN